MYREREVIRNFTLVAATAAAVCTRLDIKQGCSEKRQLLLDNYQKTLHNKFILQLQCTLQEETLRSSYHLHKF